MPLRDFKWSNVDTLESPGSPSNNGFGFVITLSVDQQVRVFNIARNFAECLITLNHDHQVICLALSPDNSLLAVGG